MSLTVRIIWQYILSRVRVSIRPNNFLCAKNIHNCSEYRVAHASGQLNRTSDAGNCGHGSSPPTSRNGNELSGDNILSRLIASGPSERQQHERRQLRSKRRQREFIPSRVANVVNPIDPSRLTLSPPALFKKVTSHRQHFFPFWPNFRSL